MQNHIPVLLKKVLSILNPTDGIIIDATLGLGGHSKEILKISKASVIGMDQDGEALEIAKGNLKEFKGRVSYYQENFSNIKKVAESLGVLGKVSGIILDLGVSSLQIDKSERGFSFQKEAPLDMRMDTRSDFTAYEIINSYSKESLVQIFREYGEERFAYKIVDEIINERRKTKIKTTTELASLIKRVVPKKYAFARIHPATKVFQALRIAVNNELNNLQKALEGSLEVLFPEGKLIVISFHSLEDRIVKRFFKDMQTKSIIQILTKKPVIASEDEIQSNPRSRSAKLRAIQKN
ncbi:16S rRNA (cytosine(1402)-N(4))-methyltransferase [bacterium CG_4_10_14_0_2_um_filter_33_32]|nr:MAG: 16S rRNA (cytosine(1402)-N(4))-methyltransferase [bacterium CG2_30_33_46]PIR67492.1 MAG: 16S rRNA (cytosine(1402)-N(4))-methyltransferase [bacterium CG10_big_fil_rev_8_21_14_0_10_33_18]PIU77010.1 MAG: 16S rRNA (cytosine(1402)-N(4))-methyltransferase [bacterium CG06_land_8_20_14_3_00_33_50]PIW81752.1 MAG: 16S rRNA (cytosine(1402)-N(4))-methyltransferase [bacterium CG_4_8_14_3_um_filter_33_28]PIY85832.1 MAG: 16S rRNA (cytosine(1402)-N(4))-methyltransferase [bacterium CG_4_10_14_0_8_um_fil